MSVMSNHDRAGLPRVLNAYLLGRLDFDELLALQRRLVYDVSGSRSTAVLLICEHPQTITIGRAGSLAHIHLEAEELRRRGLPIRWVNRGGGCLLSLPGQVAFYPIFALDQLNINVGTFLDQLHKLVGEVLASFAIRSHVQPTEAGVWVGDRRIAHVGVAIRDWVSSFGGAINLDPDLKEYRHVWCDGDPKPMTSMQREQPTRIRPATLRQRLIDAFVTRFQFERVSLFHHHPALKGKASTHAIVTHSC